MPEPTYLRAAIEDYRNTLISRSRLAEILRCNIADVDLAIDRIEAGESYPLDLRILTGE